MIRIAALILSLMAPSGLLMASTDGAILMTTGQVQINGQQAASSSTVFPGDRVQTSPNASAFVKSAGALVSIGGDSAVTYDGTSVTLQHGVVAVTVATHMDAHFGNLLITPAPGHSAKFQMVNANGIEKIADLEGSLTVTDGTHIAKLTAGEAITHEVSSSRDDPEAPHKSGIPKWVLEILIEAGIGGGIVGGLAATGAFSGHPASPSGP